MKKIVCFTLFCLFSAAFVNAQAFDPVQDSFFEEPTLAQASKKEINFSNLPQIVQNNFHDTEYTEWQIERVFEEIEDDQSTIYEIVVSSENVEQTIRFDEYGNMKEHED